MPTPESAIRSSTSRVIRSLQGVEVLDGGVAGLSPPSLPPSRLPFVLVLTRPTDGSSSASAW